MPKNACGCPPRGPCTPWMEHDCHAPGGKPPCPPDPCECCKKHECCCENRWDDCTKPPCKPCPPPPCPPKPHPRPKPRPPKPQGVLLNRIVCSERRLFPALCVMLRPEGLPRCAQPPYELLMVQQSGAQPYWTPLDTPAHDARLCLKVMIPVCCQIRDQCGKCYAAQAEVPVEVSLAPGCARGDCWRYQLVFAPCVRLRCSPVCSQDGCFEAELEVSLEIYFTQLTPCVTRPPEPPCAELPLYPPPCEPRCPAGPGPCGWPARG